MRTGWQLQREGGPVGCSYSPGQLSATEAVRVSRRLGMAFGLAPALGLDLSECPQQGPFDVGPHHLTLHRVRERTGRKHVALFLLRCYIVLSRVPPSPFIVHSQGDSAGKHRCAVLPLARLQRRPAECVRKLENGRGTGFCQHPGLYSPPTRVPRFPTALPLCDLQVIPEKPFAITLPGSHLALILSFPAEFKMKCAVRETNKEPRALFLCHVYLLYSIKKLNPPVGLIFSGYYGP